MRIIINLLFILSILNIYAADFVPSVDVFLKYHTNLVKGKRVGLITNQSAVSKSGEAVYFYAGVCNLQLGNFAEAVSNLKSYKSDDAIMNARALACIGDAYAPQNDLASALSNSKSAAAA